MGLIENNISLDLSKYINFKKKGLQTEADVEKGIMHIIASIVATNTDVLNYLRKMYDDFHQYFLYTAFIMRYDFASRKTDVNFTIESKKATTKTEKSCGSKNTDDSKFSDYFNFKIPVKYIKPHQVITSHCILSYLPFISIQGFGYQSR